MSDRAPATEKGTADRIEADDGGYWVRLVTKQALKREGECMGNCLDSMGYGRHTAGDEDMVSDGLWSLRQATGVSYLLVEVDVSYDRTKASVTEAKGPLNSDPSAWSIRQLRHLVTAFREAGCGLEVPERYALTDAEGMTWRHDKAPTELWEAYEERKRRAQEGLERQRAEILAHYAERRDRALGGRIVVMERANEIQPYRPSRAYFRPLGQPWVDPYTLVAGPHAHGDVITYEFDAPAVEMRARVEIDPSIPRPLARDLERIRERHALPAQTVQARLMSGFAQASITLTPKPRAREPPAEARPAITATRRDTATHMRSWGSRRRISALGLMQGSGGRVAPVRIGSAGGQSN